MNKTDELVVTIRREGNAIFAICGDKTAKAVCSPDDEFDYITGAKLAFERLIAPKFKVGDKIIGNDMADRYGFTKRGSEGIVVGYYDPFSHVVKVDFDTRTFAGRDKLSRDYAKQNYIAKGWSVIDDYFDLAVESSKAPKTEAPFKVGDVVIGLNKPEGLPDYAITGRNAISTVVAVFGKTNIRVKILRPNCSRHNLFIGDEYNIDARTVKKWEGFDVGDIVAPIRSEGRFDEFSAAIITEIRKENNETKAMLKVDNNPGLFAWRDVTTIRYATESEERELKARFDKHEFRVGDIVKVVDTGACYSYYYDWVIEHITEKAQIARFAYGNGMGYPATKSLNQPFIILFEKDGVAYISEDDKHKPCYVIGKRGLKHYPTR